MRITRSTLRRLISEESARLIAEAHESHGRVVGAHHRHGPGASFVAPPEEEDFEGTGDYFGGEASFDDDMSDEVDVEYGDDGYDMTEGDDMMDDGDMMEGDDMMDDDGTFGGPPRVDYDGQYTTPQYVKGTSQYAAANRGPSAHSFSQAASRGHAQGGGGSGGYGEYDRKHYGAALPSGDDDKLDEGRWAQLAGILKG
jgi:hypothetical protein